MLAVGYKIFRLFVYLISLQTIEDIDDEMSSAKSWRKLEDFLKHVAFVSGSGET